MALSTDQPLTFLKIDATNRAVRVFLQGLVIDTVIGVSVFVAANVDALTSWQALGIFGAGLARTALGSASAYVMRRFVDRWSSIGTPLPPGDPAS